MIHAYGRLREEDQLEFLPTREGLMIRIKRMESSEFHSWITIPLTELLAFVGRSKQLREASAELPPVRPAEG